MGAPALTLGKGSAVRKLTPAARRVHLAVLSHFVLSGRAPDRRRLAQLTAEEPTEVDGLLSELHAHDVLAMEDDG